MNRCHLSRLHRPSLRQAIINGLRCRIAAVKYRRLRRPRREPAAKSARAAITATPIELWRSIHPPLRPILTGAAAVTALFIMGIALGIFHSSPPPMANTTTHPSNGVTVQTGVQNGGVTVQAGSAKSQPAQPAPAIAQTKPQPGQPAQQAQSAGTCKPSPGVRQTIW